MYWDFTHISTGRAALIEDISKRADQNEIPRPLALFMIADIQDLKIPDYAIKDNYAIKVSSSGYLNAKARTWKFSVNVVDISYH